jgi:protein tyrosine phosphatase (PTP) superfamily phosphohydrolase (DUF442 family)
MNARHSIHVAGHVFVSLACALVLVVATRALAVPVQDNPLLTQLASVQNIRQPYSWLLTGGQPDSATLVSLGKTGAWDVMDLRTAAEPRGFNEPAVAKSAGLRYMAIPTSAADFSDSKFTALRHHLVAHGPQRPLFVHCGSGNRVGAALLPWLVLDRHVEEDTALAMARDIGLRDPVITQRALDYIHGRQRARPTTSE